MRRRLQYFPTQLTHIVESLGSLEAVEKNENLATIHAGLTFSRSRRVDLPLGGLGVVHTCLFE